MFDSGKCFQLHYVDGGNEIAYTETAVLIVAKRDSRSWWHQSMCKDAYCYILLLHLICQETYPARKAVNLEWRLPEPLFSRHVVYLFVCNTFFFSFVPDMNPDFLNSGWITWGCHKVPVGGIFFGHVFPWFAKQRQLEWQSLTLSSARFILRRRTFPAAVAGISLYVGWSSYNRGHCWTVMLSGTDSIGRKH